MSNAVPSELGAVVSLWRYPVKSMMGEELNATAVTERGLLGDRAYALVDSSDGKAATAKNPRKWPGLFDFRATFIEPVRPAAKVPPVRITLCLRLSLPYLLHTSHKLRARTPGLRVSFDASCQLRLLLRPFFEQAPLLGQPAL